MPVFPFGKEVKDVKQKDHRVKKYFILGVYASATHAKWVGKDGKIRVRALAVASEPSIFWSGSYHEALSTISQIEINPELGWLLPADDQYNGPSGRSLDEKYLKPLGLSREEVWLCDLVPHTCLNDGQKKAIEREYNPEKENYQLPDVTLPSASNITSLIDEKKVQAVKKELIESGAKTIILLGDIPIKKILGPTYKKLRDFVNENGDGYGKPQSIYIDGKDYEIIPFAHPRQVSGLGRSNVEWQQIHNRWIQSK